jgi:gamma-polyglutamate biosynthesis protein CapA
MSRSIALTIVFLCALYMGGLKFYEPNYSFGALLREFSGASTPLATGKEGVTFVGDVMLARKVADLSQWHGAQYPWHRLPLHPSDYYLVGNFESAIPPVYTRTPYFTFSFATPTSSIPALREYGFSHLALSNNHSFDKGDTGFSHTIEVLSRADMKPFGNAATVSTSSVVVLEVSDITISVIGISLLTTTPSLEELRLVVEYAQEQSDIQIAYVHWGTEYAPYHSLSQRQFAERLVSLGIDSIIGHHPHVIQDIDLIDGVPVFYSLGNFVFDQYFSPAVQEGLVIDLKVLDQQLQFVLRGVTSEDMQSAPRAMTPVEEAQLFARIANKSHIDITEMTRRGVITVPR